MRRLLTVAVVIALGASVSMGQVVRTQTGRALDANTRVGGGGLNMPGGSAEINSQLYVTGQVTGLGGFRGSVGYSADNALRLTLPSQAMETFQGQSVGLSQAVSGGTHLPSAYYGRSQTAMGAGDIIAGRTAGTNISRSGSSSWASGMAQELIAEATKGYGGLLQTKPQGVINIAPQSSRQWQGDGGLDTGRIRIARPVSARVPGASGLIKERDSRQLANELFEMHLIDTAIDARVMAEVDATPYAGVKPLEDGTLRSTGDDTSRDDMEATLTRGGLLDGRPAPDQDVFMDILVRLRELRERKGFAAKTAAELLEADGNDAGALVRIGTSGIVIRSLAGKSRDVFNSHMTQGGRQLRDGKYYDAVKHYQYAGIINSSNPMARLGLALAYFAAGEPMTASLHLRRAFAVFPPMMRTKLQLGKIIGDAVLAKRLAEIDRQLASQSIRDERSLVFLATFMHHSAGQNEEARRSAQMLKEMSKADKMMEAYAVYVLTGKGPDDAAPAETMPSMPGK